MNAMKTYLVGGALRDALMGLPVQDRDWVVVGGSPQDMEAAGFRAVGQDFPVFLHPQTQEEYALARTERKVAAGYRGFAFYAAPDVTLEQDLERRDLTINAMAQDESGAIIDPFGGQRDIADKLLRHVSAAFVEDPVRILRVARFAARFTEFSVAPQTMALMRHMVEHGEADALVPERVWQELARGMMEQRPSRMFEVLRECGALAKILPEVERLWGVPQRAEFHPEIDTGVHLMMVMDMSAQLRTPLAVRFACLCHDLGKGTTPKDEWPRHIAHEQRSEKMLLSVSERLRVPTECKELAQVVAREHGHVHASGGLNAAAVVRLLERCDALRRPQRFDEVLLACECDARGRLGFADQPYPQGQRLRRCLSAALSVDTKAMAEPLLAAGADGSAIGEAIRHARVAAVEQALHAQQGLGSGA